MNYICYKTGPVGIIRSVIFTNKPTIDDINCLFGITLEKEEYEELIRTGCISYKIWKYIYLEEIETVVDNSKAENKGGKDE